MTEVELRIMKVIWDKGPVTARQVHDQIHAEEGKNYSTTVKMLAVMLEKGLVRRDDSVRPQTFTAAVSRQKSQKAMVKDLMKRAFGGSAASLAMQALAAGRTSKEDLQEIRKLIDELEENS